MLNKNLAPIDSDGKPFVEFTQFKDYKHLAKIAEKRTHRLALESIRPGGNITLKEALAAAYIQGISDVAAAQSR